MSADTRTTGTETSVVLDSPIGALLVTGDADHLSEIKLPRSWSPRVRAPRADDTKRLPAALSAGVRQLREYFAGRRQTFDLPLSLAGTDFQVSVWEGLAEIPFGKTISYAELAAMVGRPSAFRAVGQANGANPIPIVLPCHRVVASGGRIGGYGGGLPMKRWLLEHEGIAIV